MRTWQAIGVVVATLFGVSLGMAQQGGQTGGGSTSPASPGKGTSTPPPSSGTRSTTQPSTSNTTPQLPRPIWISGRVIMYDGGPPPEPVTIERVCSSNSIRAEGYTDSRGQFSFNLGQSIGVFADASTSSFPDFGQQGGTNSMSSNGGVAGGGGNTNQDSLYSDCELRARLPGYRSDTVSLLQRRALDAPDVGVIVLYPLAGIQGFTTSATSGRAPTNARKAYEKGLNAVKKDKPDQAELEFRKAVQVYPKYADAWLELGKVLERREHYPEARQAYASALAADSKYVFPYQQLYQMALREQNWQDLAAKTDQLLHLNPYEFPAAYYFNALAHLQLKEYEAAEKSAEQAVEADRKQMNPKTHYLLGAILIQRKNWSAAAESLRAYLKAAPNASDKAQVEKTLTQLDRQISGVRPATDSTPQQ